MRRRNDNCCRISPLVKALRFPSWLCARPRQTAGGLATAFLHLLLSGGRVFVVTFPLSLLLPGCEELLPARDDPVNFLEADIAAIEGIVVIRAGQPVGLSGSFFITVENLHDEVLQGEAQVSSDITVYMLGNPSRRAVVSLDEAALLNDWILSGGQVTLAPDSTANILSQWNHSTSEGRRFWEFVQLTPKTNSGGEDYLESDPISFAADASVQMFKNVQAEKTKLIQFTFTYWVFE